MMRSLGYLFFLTCFLLLPACNSAPQVTTPVSINQTSTYQQVPTFQQQATKTKASGTSSAPVPDYKKMGQSLLANIPVCTGVQVLDSPVAFPWPNLASRMEEIGSALWGYFSCDQSQSETADYFKSNMTKPPFNYMEANWVLRTEGVVGVYDVWEATWMYMFIVPFPGQEENTLVVVAVSSREVECYLRQSLHYII